MEEKKQKIVRGVVISDSGDKSIKVQVDYKVKHPRYGKYINRRTKLGVHDEENAAGVGDTVDIVESRPFSKTINWQLVNVVSKAD